MVRRVGRHVHPADDVLQCLSLRLSLVQVSLRILFELLKTVFTTEIVFFPLVPIAVR
jgi:hypothetical protein